MEIIPISAKRPNSTAIKAAASCIAAGGVVVFPSDTCYGLAADPTNPAAMKKLYRIKGRPREKAVSCIFSSVDAIEQWALLTPETRRILEMRLPGAFTFLLKPHAAYPIRDEDARVGARIPDNRFTQLLADAAGPYTATSANRSGEPSCYEVDDLLKQLGASESPDLVLDAGTLPSVPPSTVINLTTSPPAIVRQGSGVFNV